ncbi:hypothetical protein [Enterococcus sp. HMSC072H05]|uniref:hypothetical protein n=1 Tax=Enterococcus sp. HMSC072H05 TaxID=1715012 RepID=UPI0008A37D3C|nr:hypothetical protein [Enterococcus sp. HMSC072H05]OFL85615.1 hypothetical protein HMPREF2742_06040 [Enterococcus sp. HMSC072H05]
MTLKFNATLRDKGLGNDDKKKILLEVPVSELKGKVEELTSFANKTVTIQVVPQYYTYSIPFDKSTNAPTQEYVVNNDGTIDFVEKEQTQLEVDEQGNIDIEDRPFEVTKEIVDEFIAKATSLQLPDNIIINPRDVITRINDGEDLGEIAESYEMSDTALINQIEAARQHFAPFANEWDKKRDEVVFQDSDAEEVDAEDENETESADLETETPDSDQSSSSNDEEAPGIDAETNGDLLGKSDPYGNEPAEIENSESDDPTEDEDTEDDPYK